MKKPPYTVTKAVHRVTQRRRTDAALGETFEDLDRTIADGPREGLPPYGSET